MTTTETGRQAEKAARTYLEMRGYKILEQNWRRPRCEIDIVAEKGDVRYFVEVKYRYDNQQGGGLEAITAAKLRQMRRGAELYIEENEYTGLTSLAAIEIAGKDFTIMSFIDNAY